MIDITGVYVTGMKPEDLATKVLSIYFKDEEPSFPIDPFKIIREMGIIYQFMDFNIFTLFANWLELICYNFPFAFFSQLFFIQPLVRTVFKFIFAKDIKAREKAVA